MLEAAAVGASTGNGFPRTRRIAIRWCEKFAKKTVRGLAGRGCAPALTVLRADRPRRVAAADVVGATAVARRLLSCATPWLAAQRAGAAAAADAIFFERVTFCVV